MRYTYLLVNFFSVIVPFAFSYHPKIRFYKQFTPFLKANIIASIIFIIWDSIFTLKGIWSFNADYVLGITLLNLPLEEVLFFICIPFSCVYTYHCSYIFFKAKWNHKIENVVVLFFSILLFAIGIFYFKKAYTCITFISASLFILALKFYFKANWLSQFISIYPVLLIPFFIVNGILTGTGLEHPVVLYNDAENLGIRMLTIPVEDMVYGFELLLLNIFLYQKFSTSTIVSAHP